MCDKYPLRNVGPTQTLSQRYDLLIVSSQALFSGCDLMSGGKLLPKFAVLK